LVGHSEERRDTTFFNDLYMAHPSRRALRALLRMRFPSILTPRIPCSRLGGGARQ